MHSVRGASGWRRNGKKERFGPEEEDTEGMEAQGGRGGPARLREAEEAQGDETAMQTWSCSMERKDSHKSSDTDQRCDCSGTLCP